MLGMGSGQPNRRESLRIAFRKAGEEAKGAALASDAFFPFGKKHILFIRVDCFVAHVLCQLSGLSISQLGTTPLRRRARTASGSLLNLVEV
jgi:hypothetical protein